MTAKHSLQVTKESSQTNDNEPVRRAEVLSSAELRGAKELLDGRHSVRFRVASELIFSYLLEA